MVQADFAGNEFNEILAHNDFAQVALLRDIKQTDGITPFVSNTGNGMKHIEITVNGGGGTVFTEDEFNFQCRRKRVWKSFSPRYYIYPQ